MIYKPFGEVATINVATTIDLRLPIERLLDHRLDEAAHLRAKICLDQIEPIVA